MTLCILFIQTTKQIYMYLCCSYIKRLCKGTTGYYLLNLSLKNLNTETLVAYKNGKETDYLYGIPFGTCLGTYKNDRSV